jgi:malate synthase
MQAVTQQARRKPDRGVWVRGPIKPGYDAVLTPEALAFVADLVRTFREELSMRLAARAIRKRELERGATLDFLPETAAIRASAWTIGPLPDELLDRRVEITGPTDRKMIINALSSGANVFMADFEDSLAPTWDNVIQGQINLRDAVRRTITFEAPSGGRSGGEKGAGKTYMLGDRIAVLMVRPRGWHLLEKHLWIDGDPAPAALVDFGLFFFHNARELIARGTGPYFYLPKMESHLEARLWNRVFERAQNALGIPQGTIKATVLIETLPAAFEMHEILWELRDHAAGLNCGRWDYIFSFIKKRSHEPGAVLPDRSQVTMDKSFLRAYSELLVKTCHRRGAFAMGGMAAYIPVKDDPIANVAAIDKVKADKLREVKAGHDGTWVAHPGLVPIAKQIFDEHMPNLNQLDVRRDDVQVGRAALLDVPAGTRTMAGLRHNIRVGIRYIEAWLGGQGCVPLYNLMEDAATAEISRTQVWQWLHHRMPVDGEILTPERVRRIIDEESGALSGPQVELAKQIFADLATATEIPEFLTLSAYDHIVTI